MRAAFMTGVAASFRIVAHTADVAVELRGDSLSELLVAATRAVRRLYAGRRRLPAHRVSDVRVEAAGPEELLVRWVNEMIYRFDTSGEAPADAPGVVVEEREGVLAASAAMPLCRMAEAGLRPHLDLKAATYHRLAVRRMRNGRLAATLVIDT